MYCAIAREIVSLIFYCIYFNVYSSLIQVPAFLDNVPALSDCDGIRYALIFTVPTLYIVSSVLFLLLGLVMQWWVRRQRRKGHTYYSFTDEAQIDRTATGRSPPPSLSTPPMSTERETNTENGSSIRT